MNRKTIATTAVFVVLLLGMGWVLRQAAVGINATGGTPSWFVGGIAILVIVLVAASLIYLSWNRDR